MGMLTRVKGVQHGDSENGPATPPWYSDAGS